MMNLTVFGQNYPTIHLINGYSVNGDKLDFYSQIYPAYTPNGCLFNYSNNYKFYSFKAGFDMTFEFDLIATKPDFNFIIWKLSKDKVPEDIYDRTTKGTIPGNRSVYDKTVLRKGIRDGALKICESESGIGYVSSFNGSELLRKKRQL